MERWDFVMGICVEKTEDVRNRISTLVGYLRKLDYESATRLENDLTGNDKKLSKKFIENNLEDDKLEMYRVLSDVLFKHKSKMKIIGRLNFKMRIKRFNEFVIIIISLYEMSDNCVDFLYGMNQLDLPDSHKRRLVYRNLMFDYMGLNLSEISNGINEMGVGEIDKLYEGSRFMYISPLEYMYADTYYGDSFNGILNYYRNMLALYVIELCKTKVDKKKLNLMVKDLEYVITVLVNYMTWLIKNHGSVGYYEKIVERGLLTGNICDIFDLRVILDMMKDKVLFDKVRKEYDRLKEDKSKIPSSDICSNLNHIVDKVSELSMYGKKNNLGYTVSCALYTVIDDYLNDSDSLEGLIEFLELVDKERVIRFKNIDVENMGDLEYTISKKYSSVVKNMKQNWYDKRDL
jgi:hypothetical protein